MSFNSLGLSGELLKALSVNHFAEAFPVQEQVIPQAIKGNDIVGIAKTGSGKTLSYILPILNGLNAVNEKKSRNIKALVLVPTRELAAQVANEFQQFSNVLAQPLKSMAVFGGVSINPQMKALYGVDVLVATPGRLIELVEAKAVQLLKVEQFVLDEADKMLNLGFKNELSRIFEWLPKKKQTMLFSATLNKNVNNIKKGLLNNPVVVKIADTDHNLDLINQQAYKVNDEKKGPLLRQLIKEEGLQQVLIFVSSIKRADNVANKLRNNGIEAWPIHSKKSQGARTDLLTKFRHGKLPVLVATDLISRGIDIEFLPCVINYELPRSPKDYIHRIGRTGRAENPGLAISLITPSEEHHFSVIQKKMGKQIELKDGDAMV